MSEVLDVPAGRAAEAPPSPWVIDADGHVIEDPSFWDRLLPEQFRHLAPRLRRGMPGVDAMFSIPGGTDPVQRLPDMDADAIERAVLFPTFGLLIYGVTDREPAAALARASNEWLAEYCGGAPDRLLGVGAVSCVHGGDALAEARRCVEELGFVGVYRSPDAHAGALPCHDPSFEPLWEYLESANVPIVTHSGSPPQAYYGDYFGDDGSLAVHAVRFVADAFMALNSFVLWGILERHPTLKVGFLECNATWALAATHRLDEHVEKAKRDDIHYDVPAKLSLTPSEYFRRQCFVSTESVEPGLPTMVERFPGSVVFASDYPHPDGAFPDSTAELMQTTALSEDQRRAVLRNNALRLYGLE